MGRPGGTATYEVWRPTHAEAAALVKSPWGTMSDHLDTVQAERAKYGTPLGNENAWKVSNATAYTWRSEGWGILAKPAGNNWMGYSVDVIINPTTKELVDCLADSEGAGTPTWNHLPWDDSYAVRYRAALPPDDVVPPSDLDARVTACEARLGVIEQALRACGQAMP
jgi:hypothetical protein